MTTTATTPSPTRRQAGHSGRTFAAIALCVAAAAGIVTTAGFAVGNHHEPAASTASSRSSTAASSATTTTLQENLATLNYYNGPTDGLMNTQTIQAITYLQRDANLPQTGHMNSATQAALNQMLISGNNQMGPG
jgi:peptidoglycan hydrolase-like protein with peptidoglycan-binding domain